VGLDIGKHYAISVLRPSNGTRFITRVDRFFAKTIICYKGKEPFATITAMLQSCSFLVSRATEPLKGQ
jgi:hypothetical protein